MKNQLENDSANKDITPALPDDDLTQVTGGAFDERLRGTRQRRTYFCKHCGKKTNMSVILPALEKYRCRHCNEVVHDYVVY